VKFRRERRIKARAALDMTPLVDVVLLLLLFFMISSTFVAHRSIPIEMPQVASGVEEKPALEDKDISITLAKGDGGPDEKGPIYMDEKPVASMDALETQLTHRREANPDVTLLILVDQNASSGRLVEVLGIANNAGIRHFNIAAQLPEAAK